MKNVDNFGFSPLKVILVVTALFLLTGITVLAINPGDKLGDKNNSQRKVDISKIANAIHQYSTDNAGVLPKTILSTTTEICKTGARCAGLINLSVLTVTEKYLSTMPIDPNGGTDNGTNYLISKTASGSITVSAPRAEKGEIITITR
ncbi:MAG: hypothetical protein WCN88_02300 [Candidatus Falkowbacteria bacterium]